MDAIPPLASWRNCRSVQQVPGLSEKEQGELKACLQRLCQKHLDSRKLWQDQSPKAKTTLCTEARNACRFLSRYVDEWPVESLLRNILIVSRSKLKTRGTAPKKPGRTDHISKSEHTSSSRSARTTEKRKRRTQALRATKANLSDNDLESEDEVIKLSDRVLSNPDACSSEKFSSGSVADVNVNLPSTSVEDVQRHEAEDVLDSPNPISVTMQALADDTLTADRPELDEDNDEVSRHYKGDECKLMGSDIPEINVDEDIQMENSAPASIVISGSSSMGGENSKPVKSAPSACLLMNSVYDVTPSRSGTSVDTTLPSVPRPIRFLNLSAITNTTKKLTTRFELGGADGTGHDAPSQALNDSGPESSMAPHSETMASLSSPSAQPMPSNLPATSSPTPIPAPSPEQPPPDLLAQHCIHRFLHDVFPPLSAPEIVQRFVDAGIVEREHLLACARLPERDQLAMLRTDLGLNILYSRMVRAALERV